MTTETLPTVTDDEKDHKRKAALWRAIGFDKLSDEQREIALEYSRKYGLDLVLRHVVIVEGKPYVTRDALLHVAHRSGQLDGYEVTEPVLEEMPGLGQFWRARCTVYRKDMTRSISLTGRYPAKGGNQRFAPEMAVKVAEVMTLRRAFDISAPVFEERWDVEVPERGPEPTITETIAAKRAAMAGADAVTPAMGSTDVGSVPDAPMPAPDPDARCLAFHAEHGRCERDADHEGPHRGKKDGEVWEA